MNDKVIIELFKLDTLDIHPDPNRYVRQPIVNAYANGKSNKDVIIDDNIIQYVQNRYNDSLSFKESLYRIRFNIETRPVCPICGKRIEFIGLTWGFKEYCSKECNNEGRSRKMTIHEKKPKHANDINDVSQVDDSYIINMFFTNKSFRETANLVNSYNHYDINNGNITKRNKMNIHIYTYLKNRYNDTDNITETLYRILHKINKKPVCKICKNPVNFVGLEDGYRDTCSMDCYKSLCEQQTQRSLERKLKEHNDILNLSYKEKFNKDIDDNIIKEIFNNDPEYRRKLISAYSKLELGIASKKIEIYSDVLEYLKNRYTDSKSLRETIYRILHNIEIRPTCKICGKQIQYIGKPNAIWSVYCSSKCKYEDTKDNLLTAFNPSETSNSEKGWMIDFKEIFDGDIVTSNMSAKSEYKDERYPYKYDFYIKEVDLFIEYQGFNTHGVHPYRGHCDDAELIKMIDRLDEGRANKVKYVWTKNDVEKRRTAKHNNLNFLELWPKDFIGKKRHKIIIDGLREMKGKTKEEIQNIIKRISLHETIYDENIYLGE